MYGESNIIYLPFKGKTETAKPKRRYSLMSGSRLLSFNDYLRLTCSKEVGVFEEKRVVRELD